MKFKAKNNVSLKSLLIIGSALLIFLVALSAYYTKNILQTILASVLLGIIMVLAFIMVYKTSYEITEKYLVASVGFAKIEIRLCDILEIKKVKNLKFSFATSPVRAEIRYGSANKRWSKIYVSPDALDEFIDVLEEKVKEAKAKNV